MFSVHQNERGSESFFCTSSFCNWVEGGVQILDDIYGERLDPGRRRVYLMVRRKLLVQPKVELDHPVVTGVFGPHEANVWLMEHIYCSSKSFPVGFPPADKRLERTCSEKIWRNGTLS